MKTRLRLLAAVVACLLALAQQSAFAQIHMGDDDSLVRPGGVSMMAGYGPSEGCTDCGGGGCASCMDKGCTPWGCGIAPCGWMHRVAVFGEHLYLRSRNSEVHYATEVDSATNPLTTPPVQFGRVGVVDQDYSSGFRFGGSFVIDCANAIDMTYTRFETDREDLTLRHNPNNVVQSNVFHPNTQSASSGGVLSTARHFLRFETADVDYRHLFACCDNYQISYLVGARYANLRQRFFSTTQINGVQDVDARVNFDGVGLRLGLAGERYFCRHPRLFTYGKGIASLMAGEFRGAYGQGQDFDHSEVDAAWRAGRIVPIFDLEVGIGLRSKCGTWRATAGYLFNAWTNVVRTNDFVQGARFNDFRGLGDAMTFDGLVTRVEARF